MLKNAISIDAPEEKSADDTIKNLLERRPVSLNITQVCLRVAFLETGQARPFLQYSQKLERRSRYLSSKMFHYFINHTILFQQLKKLIEEYEPKKEKKKSSHQQSEFARNLQRSMNMNSGEGSTSRRSETSIKLREDLTDRDIREVHN